MLNYNTSKIALRAEKADNSVPGVKGLRRKKEHPEVTLSSSMTLFRIWLKYPKMNFYLEGILETQ